MPASNIVLQKNIFSKRKKCVQVHEFIDNTEYFSRKTQNNANVKLNIKIKITCKIIIKTIIIILNKKLYTNLFHNILLFLAINANKTE